MIKLIVLLTTLVSLSGCASINAQLKAWFGKKETTQMALDDDGAQRAKFSDQENYEAGSPRRYKRMNKDQFEQDANVGAQAGSLWVMEGQGGYLFAQNNNRLIGDILNISIDGAPKQQLQTKTRVITKLLEKLDQQQEPAAPAMRGLSSVTPGAPGAPAADAAAPAVADAKPEAKEPKFEVTNVPARVVETMKDGSYRVRGAQTMMIGKREYKVIVTGIVRPGDFNEDGTLASKMLDGQFDIVSSKKGMAAL
jgi:flagellar L-ring protein precursor FlgH